MSQSGLKPPKDLWHHLSESTKARNASHVKQFYKYFRIPGIAQLAGGLPYDGYFPFDTLEAKIALPERWKPSSPSKPTQSSSAAVPRPSSHLLVPKYADVEDLTRRIDVATALQYGNVQGYPALYEFIKKFALEYMHPDIPYLGGPDIVLTCGATDGFAKALMAFNNEWAEGRDPIERKEGLLCESFAYMNAIQAARPRGMNIVTVKMDQHGMKPEGPGGLRDVLENWDTKKGKRPHMMYTVTMGHNPTGIVIPVSRRKEIYALCQEYDVIIVEDDPYWYLQYPSAMNGEASSSSSTSKDSFLSTLTPSYLAIDSDGRVVRLDTFSKTIAPGCRMGWITAQPALIERILRIAETSTQNPSGFVQSMVAALLMGGDDGESPEAKGKSTKQSKSASSQLSKPWSFTGWTRWLAGLRGEYERRMLTVCEALDQGASPVRLRRRREHGASAAVTESSGTNSAATHDDADSEPWTLVNTARPIYSFRRPDGGMFVWVRFHFATHPLSGRFAGAQLATALWVWWTKSPWRVLVSPGGIFAPERVGVDGVEGGVGRREDVYDASSDDIKDDDDDDYEGDDDKNPMNGEAWEFFRLCFAAVETAELEKGMRRLVQGAWAFWRVRDEGVIRDLLGELEAPPVEEENLEMGEMMCRLTGWC